MCKSAFPHCQYLHAASICCSCVLICQTEQEEKTRQNETHKPLAVLTSAASERFKKRRTGCFFPPRTGFWRWPSEHLLIKCTTQAEHVGSRHVAHTRTYRNRRILTDRLTWTPLTRRWKVHLSVSTLCPVNKPLLQREEPSSAPACSGSTVKMTRKTFFMTRVCLQK